MLGDMTAHTLPLDGVNLHYETRGEGPTLLLIAGGATDAAIFAGLADVLADRYRVVTYDPRGNSRSPLTGPPSDIAIPLLADDARQLLEVLGGSPAQVFGSSSGAITGLDLLTRFPQLVRRLVAHEPPMFSVLPDAGHWHEQLQDLVAASWAEGVAAGMQRFATLMLGVGLTPGQTDAPDDDSRDARHMVANAGLFLAHEVVPFTRYRPDLEALGARRQRVVLAVGAESSELPPTQPARWLADRFGLTLQVFPGNHVGYAFDPDAFAQQLDAQLQAG